MSGNRIRNDVAPSSAILLGSGAYDDNPIIISCVIGKEIAFGISYTRGGASGAVSYKVEFSNNQYNWFQSSAVSEGTTSLGSDTVSLTQRNEIKYQATGVSLERVMSPNFIVSGKFVRISAKESGAVGTPGTCAIEYFLIGDY